MNKTKKIFYTAFLGVSLTAFAPATYGQSDSDSDKFKFGIKGGANTSFMYGKATEIKIDNIETKRKFPIGYQVGLYGEYQISDIFGIELGAVYTSLKHKMADKDEKIVAITFSYNYLQIPLVAKIYPEESRELYLLLGLKPALLLSAKSKVKYLSKGNKEEKEEAKAEDIKEKCESFDLAAVAGIGYEFDFGLIAELTYNFGFMNTMKYDKTIKNISKDNQVLKNQNVNLSLGFNFAKLME